jgi:fatty-acyl-CoA synthase
MDGLMMNTPLTLQSILERSRTIYPKKEVVTRQAAGMHRYTYRDMHARVMRLAGVLRELGIKPGDRVATFAWNTYRHLELYFAIPCVGAVLHTLNIRLACDQLAYIINHAEDQVIFLDPSLYPIIKQLKPQLKTVRHFIVLDDSPIEDENGKIDSYEKLLDEAPREFEFPELKEEMAAGLCYTSGTTGNPKGVLYSHRSFYLHSLSGALVDTLGLSEKDIVLPVVPMFHANAWGIPYTAAMIGATQVHPGQFMQPRDLLQLFEQEHVTMTAGVPTIWIGIMSLLEKESFDLSSLRMVLIGGSAVPTSMIRHFQSKYGIPVTQAWGMTETSPLGSVCRLKSSMLSLSDDEKLAILSKQGLPSPGVEIRAVNDEGEVVPWDGKTLGELQVRGPWVARAYYNTDERKEAFQDGWFATGDVVTIDPEGYITIADRTKDLIKSGGEWISSVDMESALLGHPKIQEAAVIAVAHDKWVERPMACVVPKPDWRGQLDEKEILDYLRGKFAPWWLPDAIVFIEEIPKTSVGKFDKKQLREIYRDFQLPAKEKV